MRIRSWSMNSLGCTPCIGLRSPLLGYKPHRLNTRLNHWTYTNKILGTFTTAQIRSYHVNNKMELSPNPGESRYSLVIKLLTWAESASEKQQLIISQYFWWTTDRISSSWSTKAERCHFVKLWGIFSLALIFCSSELLFYQEEIK